MIPSPDLPKGEEPGPRVADAQSGRASVYVSPGISRSPKEAPSRRAPVTRDLLSALALGRAEATNFLVDGTDQAEVLRNHAPHGPLVGR